MKEHTFSREFLQFLLITALFALPPLFARNASPEAFTAWKFPVLPVLYACFAALLLRYSGIARNEPCSSAQSRRIMIYMRIGYASASFGALCVISSVIELVLHFTGSSVHQNVALPSTAISVVFCIVEFACSSFFEEVLYRFYLPEALISLLTKIPRFRYSLMTAETVCIMLFACAHRYLGIPSVINAAAAGIILRLCYKKSGSVSAGTAAHFLYNLLSLCLFSKL
jgi:membrane protease YdiL (CAAX protease family)